MPMLGLSAAAFTTAATAATVTTATTAAATAAASAAFTATLTSIAIKVGINVAISAAMSLLQPNVGAAGRTFEWTLDPDGPIPFAAGRVGVAGSAVYRRTFGPDLMYYGIPSVISGAGPIDGFEKYLADDDAVVFNAAGMCTSPKYYGEMWCTTSLGRQPDTALVSPAGLKNGASLTGWTAANRLSGKASYLLVMGENSKGTAYPTGEVKPIITVRGLKGWDPRLDSTYPGGSGPCRLHDPSTWVYVSNPILWALKWCLGLWEGPTGKGAPQVDYQVGGCGAKLSGIDVPAFVAAANVADANGWKVSAYPTTDDDKGQVLDAFLQAGGAIYAQRAGKISCIQRAAPRASVVTISAADTAGPLEIDTASSRIDRINTIRPRFWSEAHRWQMTALPEVTAAAYQADDGGKRTRGLDLHYVSDAKQAAQLAALQIANTREGVAGTIPLKPHLQRIRPGDAFTITEPGFVLNGLKCLCLNTEYDPATGVVKVSFVSETDAKYPFAMGQSPVAPEPPVLTPVDLTHVSPPLPEDWTIVVRPPAPGGGQLPGFDLGGVVSNDTATAVIVEYGLTAEGPWTQAYQGPPTVTNIPIDGVQPGATYFVAVQYQRDQNYSERYVYGPYTAPLLVSDNTNNVGTRPASQVVQSLDEVLLDVHALEIEATAIDSRTSSLEVRANPRQNLIINSTGNSGIDGWIDTGGNVPLLAAPLDSDGPKFYAAPDGMVAPQVSSYRPVGFAAEGGRAYSLQVEMDAPGMTAGRTRVYVAFRDATGGVTGYVVCAREFSATGWQRVMSENNLAPAGTKSATIHIDTEGAAFAAAGFPQWRRLKLEASPTCSAWTDDATTADLVARVAEAEGAILTADNKLQAWSQKRVIAGMAQAFAQMMALDDNGEVTSSVRFGAGEVGLWNQIGGEDQWVETLSLKGGNAAFSGNISVGGGIFLGTGTVWALALRAQPFERGDGETISFGGAPIGIPNYEFMRDNLLPLNTSIGETYDLRLDPLTAAGATVYAKINVPGASTAQSVAATSTVQPSGPSFQLLRAAKPESVNGAYAVTVSGLTNVRVPANAFELERSGTAVIDIHVRKAGVWSRVGSLEAYWSRTFNNMGGATYYEDILWSASGAIQFGSGVEGWGAKLANSGGLTAFGPVTWTSAASPSGVRSALAPGAKTTIRITPQG